MEFSEKEEYQNFNFISSLARKYKDKSQEQKIQINQLKQRIEALEKQVSDSTSKWGQEGHRSVDRYHDRSQEFQIKQEDNTDTWSNEHFGLAQYASSLAPVLTEKISVGNQTEPINENDASQRMNEAKDQLIAQLRNQINSLTWQVEIMKDEALKPKAEEPKMSQLLFGLVPNKNPEIRKEKACLATPEKISSLKSDQFQIDNDSDDYSFLNTADKKKKIMMTQNLPSNFLKEIEVLKDEIKKKDEQIQCLTDDRLEEIRAKEETIKILSEEILKSNANLCKLRSNPALKGLFKKSKGRISLDIGEYEGDYIDGKAFGKGTLKFHNGDSYDGEMRSNKPHGYGQLVSPNGCVRVGKFENGNMNGKGVIRFVRKAVEDPNHAGKVLRSATTIWSKEEEYDGDIKNNKKCGLGKLTFADQSLYIGEFDNDMMSGFGRYFYTNGDVYEGYFKDGKKEGFGCLFEYSSSTIIRGNYKEDLMHGSVTRFEQSMLMSYKNGHFIFGSYLSKDRKSVV